MKIILKEHFYSCKFDDKKQKSIKYRRDKVFLCFKNKINHRDCHSQFVDNEKMKN
jgi:hypothetical protein